MKIPLAVLLVSCTWQTIADGDSGDESCRFGYYTNSGQYEESFHSCGSADYCCGDLMDRSCCHIPEYSDDHEESPTIGLMFGSIAACIMFIVLCACICGKMARRQLPASDPAQPYTVQQNSTTVGDSPFTSLSDQTVTFGVGPAIPTSPLDTQARDITAAPPPSYEECLDKNFMLSPPAYQDVGSFTNNAYSSSEHVAASCTSQSDHVESPASSEWV